MSKQDRQGVRTVPGLEQKYRFKKSFAQAEANAESAALRQADGRYMKKADFSEMERKLDSVLSVLSEYFDFYEKEPDGVLTVALKHDAEMRMDLFDKYGRVFDNGMAAGGDGAAADPDTTMERLIVTAVHVPEEGAWYYVTTQFQEGKTTDANRSQIAIPVYGETGVMCYRQFALGGWSAWTGLVDDRRIKAVEKVDLPLASGFTVWDGESVYARKTSAGAVEIHGVVSPYGDTNGIGTVDGKAIAHLPDAYIPSVDVYAVCQGEEGKEWLLTIRSDGAVMASRYRSGSVLETPAVGCFMAFHAMYIL